MKARRCVGELEPVVAQGPGRLDPDGIRSRSDRETVDSARSLQGDRRRHGGVVEDRGPTRGCAECRVLDQRDGARERDRLGVGAPAQVDGVGGAGLGDCVSKY